MAQEFDLVVIGTGVAGGPASRACREAGWKVAVIDREPYGGTCALRGCVPKKALRRGAEILDEVGHGQRQGIVQGMPALAWKGLVDFKRSFTNGVPESNEERFAEAGVARFHGVTRFTGRTSLEVEGEVLKARKILIASGAEPRKLGMPGEQLLVTSDGFMELDALPAHIVFVGDGYIAFEFAHIAARAGARVTLLGRGPRPLKGFDPDLVDRLVKRSKEAGIEIKSGSEVEAVERAGQGFLVHAKAQGGALKLEAGLVVHAAGRVPAIEDLDLEKAGVERAKHGIEVDRHLRSVSNPDVYAAGDAAAGGAPPLTPVASIEGLVAMKNLLEGDRHEADYRGLPSVVFTVPALAQVGLGEEEARSQGHEIEVKSGDMASWMSSRRVGESCAAYKILLDKGDGRILGAHLIGPGAEETINLFALAIRTGLTASDLKALPTAYPSHASDVPSML